MELILSISLIIAFILSYMLLIQIFTVLFRLTGLTKEKARFQVISLLTNSGYTTNEAELVTTNLSRRKIAKCAMISGTVFNVVIASLFINILLTINAQNQIESFKILGIAIGSFVAFMIIMRLPFVRKPFNRFIEKVITRIKKKKMLSNIITVIDSYGKKSVCEVFVAHIPQELENKTFEEAPLRSKYNINVLTIQRHGKTVNVKKDTRIQKGDRIVMYGITANVKELFEVDINIKEEKRDNVKLNDINVVDNYGANALCEVTLTHLPEELKDKTLSQSDLKAKYDITVLMIMHGDQSILVNADTKLKSGDKVVVIGPYAHIENIFINEVEFHL